MARHLRLIFLYFSLLTLHSSLASAQSRVDSLQARIRQEKDDKEKVSTLNLLARDLGMAGKLTKADSVVKLAIDLGNRIGDKQGAAGALSTSGFIEQDMGNYNDALTAHSTALKIYKDIKDTLGIMRLTGNVGIDYYNMGEYPKALDADFTTLAMARKAHNTNVEANTLSNIGLVYWNQGELDKAIGFCDSAVSLYKQLNNKDGIARNTGNIGVIYYNKHNFPKALEYLERALGMNEQLGRKGGVIRNTNNIGNIYSDEADYDKAIEYFTKGLDMAQEIGDKSDMAISLGDIGEVYFRQKKYEQAEDYYRKGLAEAEEIQSLEMIKAYNQSMSELYAATGQYQKALQCFKDYNKAKDTLTNADKSRQIGKLEAKADYDKQLALEQASEDKQNALAMADSRRQKMVIIFIAAITFAAALIALVIMRSLNVTRKQKTLIEEQKEVVEQQKVLVEEKNIEMMDSIGYAKRLQDAILPPLSEVKRLLPQSFVLYKPKDIVAGDFYWLEFIPSLPLPSSGEGESSNATFSPLVGRTQEGMVFLAACDCTGHGVPGAMVSVVCSNALNRAVKEFGITDPGKILDKTRELVLETFEKSEGEIKDGMDISLLALTPNPLPSEEGVIPSPKGEGQRMRAQWAGAYNTLWYIQNGELKEIQGDKQPIGKHDNPKPFTTHTITITPPLEGRGEAMLYLFTDGYPDQFGGPKGKKLKYQPFMELLKSVSHLPVEEQKARLDEFFEEWKGMQDQTDDVCVIGIRI